jgi:hypothetical protein
MIPCEASDDCGLKLGQVSLRQSKNPTPNAEVGRSFRIPLCGATPKKCAEAQVGALTLGPKRGDDLFELRIAAQRFPEGLEFEPGVIDVAGHRYQLLQ